MAQEIGKAKIPVVVIGLDSTVQTLTLSTWITGTLSEDIADLHELVHLDLSFNQGLGGELPRTIGKLVKLRRLILVGCSFSGSIPPELGQLSRLSFLSLNSNKFNGSIPSELGNLSSLIWFDVTDNYLSGSIPVSNETNIGLDMLNRCEHLHFGKNNLSGSIPAELFHSNTSLRHVLFDSNKLTGIIPSTLGLVVTLEALRLDRNSLSGPVPSNLNNLTKLVELDMSNNSFDQSDVPPWFSTLPKLTTLFFVFFLLNMNSIQILSSMAGGCRPTSSMTHWTWAVISATSLLLLIFGKIEFRTCLMEGTLKHYYICFLDFPTLRLEGNPYCNKQESVSQYCNVQQQSAPDPYSTPMQNCGSSLCPSDQEMSPTCTCSYPYEGRIVFRFLTFSNIDNFTIYQVLEKSLYDIFQYYQVPATISLKNPKINIYNYFEVDLWFFPAGKSHFDESEVALFTNLFSNTTFKAPDGYGPYYFDARPYPFRGNYMLSFLLYLYLLISLELNTSCFYLKKEPTCHPVYRGALDDGQLIAVKRAQEGSMQGGLEFRTEIEMLSRVHHRNLVSLVGFCFDQNEQILVYEYIPNGSLRDSLSGKSGVHLDWKKRLRVALGAARGLTYLHELASPRIIHRDIKSNNILLDHHLNAKVSDFGLCKPLSDDKKGHITTQVKGTMGYLDPEYYMTQQLTEKSDVYSFGILLLELVTGRRPIERGRFVVREVRNAMDSSKDLHGLHELLDPAICMNSTLPGFKRFIDLAMRCVDESSTNRPWMSEAAKEIENIMVLAGMNPYNNPSETYSASFGVATRSHPYNSDASFDYSGGLYSPRVEPK
ncbi:hypothetical protein Cni_G21522 [Canna indica]|uniref:non-specific serine/threonine protein kinase n=1 Tax=Canna indica TaxID=4628 RepID=A0AAQ3KQZ2_9LILI|nr:hypothetical protein Cni_G21522 [Canna indica]